MSRYQVTGEWTDDSFVAEGVVLQVADIYDTKSMLTYRDGAYRVLVDGRLHRGKGGTVPFFGEMAWAQARSLAGDIAVGRALSGH